MVKALKVGTRVSFALGQRYHVGHITRRRVTGVRPDDHRYDVRIEREDGRKGVEVRQVVTVYQTHPSADNWEEVAG